MMIIVTMMMMMIMIYYDAVVRLMAARSREVNNHWKPFYLNCNVCNQRWSSSSSSSSSVGKASSSTSASSSLPTSPGTTWLSKWRLSPEIRSTSAKNSGLILRWRFQCFDFNGRKWNFKSSKAANIENFLTQILKNLMMLNDD